MMGRRPTLSHTSTDFLTQDPMLGSQPSLSPSIHSGLGSTPAAPPWSWMPPHTHLASPDFFQSHISGGWLGHDHERSRERIEDCLFTSPRSHAPPLINGTSAGSFSAGSGIFYPHATSSQPSVHNFPHHSSSWNNHNNHTQRGSFDHTDNHDADLFSLPMRPRHTSMGSDDGTKNLLNKHTELPTYLPDRDHRLDKPKDVYHERSLITDHSTGVIQSSHYQDKTMPTFVQTTPSVIKGVNVNKTPPIHKPTKDIIHQEPKLHENKQDDMRKVNPVMTSPVITSPVLTSPSYMQQPNRTEVMPSNKQPIDQVSAFTLPPVTQDSKILPPPPKLTKTKAAPPPRLQVPKSILNDREAVPQKVSPGFVEKSKDVSNSFSTAYTQPVNVVNTVKRTSLNSNEPIAKEQKMSASKEALLQKLKERERPVVQQTDTEQHKKPVVTSKPVAATKPISATKPVAATKPLVTTIKQQTPKPQPPPQVKTSTAPALKSPPKIPSGKPLHMARFRLPYNNEDTSDEESDSSEGSSESGSGSEATEEGEGKEEGEEEESGSGSESDSDTEATENEEEGGDGDGDDDEEDDDEDEDESTGIVLSQDDNNHSGAIPSELEVSTSSTGMLCLQLEFELYKCTYICMFKS